MAELDIGQQCSVSECKQLDFLPCQCDLCGMVFCKDHASYDAHSCSRYDQASLRERNAADTAAVLFSCSFAACRNRELIEVCCMACGKNFCLAHRHCTDHQCPNDPAKATTGSTATNTEALRQLINAQLSTAKPAVRPKLSQKSAATAAKVALIKMKQKAVGDRSVPDADRVFFNVILPLGSSHKSIPMFFSRHWCVGKAIDKVALTADIPNMNNVAGAKQLCMFEANSGLLCANGKTFASILDSADEGFFLLNGSTMIVEYVGHDVTCLESLELYSV